MNERSLQQLCDAKGNAVVFIFTRTECPIANRYAPEIRRLQEKFAPQGVSFELVYPEASDSAAAIREHLAAFQYRCDAWRDPAYVAVRRFGPTVTPEVAVFDCRIKKMTYRGRIDDLYVDFGQARQAATTHYLEDALLAVLADRPVSLTTTAAVGCLISELP
ncbi:MAG TPA: redoxin domain-containing protein [Pirellulales bacterium]